MVRVRLRLGLGLGLRPRLGPRLRLVGVVQPPPHLVEVHRLAGAEPVHVAGAVLLPVVASIPF